MRRLGVRLLATGTIIAGCGVGARAQDQPSTFKSLVGEGYGIRAVTVVPNDVVKRGGSTSDADAVIITLQRAATVAICYTEFSSYVSGAFYNLPCNLYQ